MRITRQPLAVTFFKGHFDAKPPMLEPSRKPVHFIYTITDDGKESSWLQNVQAVPGASFKAKGH